MSDTSYQIEEKLASKNGYSTPAESNAAYKVKYARNTYIVHWWGAPGTVGNHDQTVDYILRQAQAGNMSVNYCVSDDKITMIVPPDMVSWGSGSKGNPIGVNVEHSPTLGPEGYKKAGWLKCQLEQRWGKQLTVTRHKDYMDTACPGTIDLNLIEAECDNWRRGVYDAPAPAAPVLAPAPPPPTESFSKEFIDEVTIQIKIPKAQRWDLNRREWKAMSDNPLGSLGYGSKFKSSTIAHHMLGGKYYMTSPNIAEGYNVADCEVVPAEEVPAPPATPTSFTTNTVNGIVYEAYDGNPRQMFIRKQPSAEKWDFGNAKSWRDFKEVDRKGYGDEVFIAGIAHHPIPPNGADYYMTSDDFGDFKRTGHPAQTYGFNKVDLSANRPPAPVMDVAAPQIAPEAAPVEPADAWKTTYRDFVDAAGNKKPVMYVTLENYIVSPLDGIGKSVPLHVTDYILLSGTFTGPDGTTVYGRPKDATDRGLFHGVPLDANPKIVDTKDKVFSTTTTPAERKVLGRTTLNDRLVFLASDLQNLLDILEKVWDKLPFKNKKSTNIKK